MVDNSDFPPSRLTSHCDSPYDKETVPATPFQAARIRMSVHMFLFLFVFFLLSLALLWHLGWLHLPTSPSRGGAIHSTVHRLLKPRTPDDCPACRLASPASSAGEPVPVPVRPWCEVKSRRGAPKRVNTEGFACPNPQCRYFSSTDPRAHALIVLAALAEGLDPSAAERVFGFRQATLTRWLMRAGKHAQVLHERSFCQLRLPHLQLDELRTRLRCSTRVLWIWLAIDPLTKILPVLSLGPRTQNAAHTFIHSLRGVLAPGCLPLFTSDGLNLYFYALTAHFGTWRQEKRRGRNTPVMRLGTEDALKAVLQGLGLSGRLNTAFIERVNLTVRHGVAALARRTWATAQQSSHLLAHLEWWRAYYHFVRPHASLRVALVQPRERGGNRLAQRYRQRTPAMAASMAKRRWTAREVLSCPLVPISA